MNYIYTDFKATAIKKKKSPQYTQRIRPWNRWSLKQELLREQAHTNAQVHSSIHRDALRVGREAVILYFGGC